MSWKTLDDYELAGKTVLLRVDVNVPFENGEVSDFTRIDRIAPTLQTILDKGGKPVLLAHFGRPKGQIVPEMSLAPVANAMSTRLGLDVQFCNESRGANAAAAVATLPEGSVMLLENTRFHAGEEKNDASLAKEFAALGNIYCNDAFSAAHRAHASTEAIAHLLPSCAGRLMQAELEALESALANPKPPIVTVVGGAKVSTKLELLDNLIAKVDTIIIGGGMANTFLAARGFEVGKSLCEHDLLDTARAIEEKAKAQNCTLYLPSDIVVAKEFKAHAENQILPVDQCPKDAMILDAGPKSVSEIDDIFAKSKTLIWNGPLGAFEIPPFHQATNAAAKRAAILTKQGALSSFAGGGDTVSALNQAGVAEDFTYISTAGGAFLEWLEGKTLPGVAALQSNS